MNIKPGLYTISELCALLGFSLALCETNGVPDYRRVLVGGVSFDGPDKKIRVPEESTEVHITLDGATVASAVVSL